METIGIIGNGSWGTALAVALARNDRPIRIWGRNTENLMAMDTLRENQTYLDGVPLPKSIIAEPDLEALQSCQLLLAVIPAQTVRHVLEKFQDYRGTMLICAKGIERSTGLRLSEVLSEIMPAGELGVLSGPSFAREVALGKPTGLVCGTQQLVQAEALSKQLSSPNLRVYPSNDITGIEIGGALKKRHCDCSRCGYGFGARRKYSCNTDHPGSR